MDAKKVNGSGNGRPPNEWRVKVGLAEMLKGGVIMDVTTAEQAEIAEKAGACAVMALERVPSDIRKEGGVARMASIKVIREIMKTVTHSGDGQGAHRPFCRSGSSAGAGSGLHRRERSADARRRRESHLEARLSRAVRLRRAKSGRSAAAHCRRRGDDSHQGRSRLRQRGGSGSPHAHHRCADEKADHYCATTN